LQRSNFGGAYPAWNTRIPTLSAGDDTIESLRAENELLKKLFDDASMSAFRATNALLDRPNDPRWIVMGLYLT
jgi:hypothetical protein